MAPEWFIDLIGDERAADIIARYTLSLLIILFTFFVLRSAASFVLQRLVRFTRRTSFDMDEALVSAINPALRNILLLIGLWLALAVLDFNDDIANVISSAAVVLIAASFFWGLYRSVDVIADAFVTLAERDERIDSNLLRFGRQLSKALVIVIAFVVVMDQLGYNLNGLLAGLGIGGLAVALAAQDGLSNLVGYFMIVADSPFHIGDFIVTDAGSGTVEHVGFRSTHIRQLDQSVIFIPNGVLASGSITNWSRLSRRRLDMYLGLTYDTKPDQMLTVVQAIRDMMDAHPRVIPDTLFVQFFEFNESSLDVRIICYINEPGWNDFHAIKEDIYIRIMRLLDERGVGIAFPTRTIVMQDTAAIAVEAQMPDYRQPLPKPNKPASNADLDQEQPSDTVSSDEVADAEEARGD
jgi:MscS family membrane protein